jgi:hypothetical protein
MLCHELAMNHAWELQEGVRPRAWRAWLSPQRHAPRQLEPRQQQGQHRSTWWDGRGGQAQHGLRGASAVHGDRSATRAGRAVCTSGTERRKQYCPQCRAKGSQPEGLAPKVELHALVLGVQADGGVQQRGASLLAPGRPRAAALGSRGGGEAERGAQPRPVLPAAEEEWVSH